MVSAGEMVCEGGVGGGIGAIVVACYGEVGGWAGLEGGVACLVLACDHFVDEEAGGYEPGGGAVGGGVVDFHAAFVEVFDEAEVGGGFDVGFVGDGEGDGTPEPGAGSGFHGDGGVGAGPDVEEGGVG